MRTTLSSRRKQILIEALLVYGLTIGSIIFLYQMRGFLPFGRYLWTLAMLLQVYVPAWMLQRQGGSLIDCGFHLKGWQQSLRLWLLCCLIFLIPTIIGHDIWQHYNGHLVQEKIDYRKFQMDMVGTPPSLQNQGQVQIYTKRQQPILIIRWQAPLTGTLETDGKIKLLSGKQWIRGALTGKKLHISGGGFSQTTTIELKIKGKYLKYKFIRDGAAIPSHQIRLGSQLTPSRSNTLTRDFSWIILLIITQCLMVALPEEMFYRGYLLTRFDAIFPVRYVFGIPVSWGNLIVSILFALTHFLIGFEPHRLGVFFPSLVFGVLRQRTGSLLAPILFHASSNILVKLLEIWYL